jgi:EF-P beta-lysylation protein EpmB
MLTSLELDPADCPYELFSCPNFRFRVPLEYVARMRRRDWFDPLLLQVLPRREEGQARRGFDDDPVGDRQSAVVRGLLHKYRSRVLIAATDTCAVHCRYCFRRELRHAVTASTDSQRAAVWEYLRERPEIDEVILSGGDPLMLSSPQFDRLFENLFQITHVRTVRIHTRVPIVVPSRIDHRVMALLGRISRDRQCVMVVHANCAEELEGECADTLVRLRKSGALLLNQSVLLRGINDTAPALERLSHRLISLGVLPYYLHQLDRAHGTWHFEVPPRTGRRLMAHLRRNLPGYAVPKYVREQSGAPCKLPLDTFSYS